MLAMPRRGAIPTSTAATTTAEERRRAGAHRAPQRAACGSDDNSSTSGASNKPGALPGKQDLSGKKGGTLKVLASGDVDYIDPAWCDRAPRLIDGGEQLGDVHL